MSETESPHHVPVEWLDAPASPGGSPPGAPAAPPPLLSSPKPDLSRRPSGRWQGWAFFGACIMALLGFFQALLGLVALFDDGYFAVRTNDLLVVKGYSAWGWVHLIVGAVAVVAGLGVVLSGRAWARYTAIVVAGLSAIANLGFLSASPVWSTLVIALDVVVIYALGVHGWEIDRS